MVDEKDEDPAMSAECQVEALPLSGADISVDGLRLRLDIRIVPRGKSDARASDTDALFRVVTAKISRASEMPAYQWAAIMFGVGVLLVAVTLWIAGPRAAPPLPEPINATAPAPSAKTPVAAPTREAAPSPSSGAPAAAVAVESSPPPPAVAGAPAFAPPAPRIQQLEPAQPSKVPGPPRKTATPARTPVATAAPASPAPQPVAQRAARTDMLDLFGDTK